MRKASTASSVSLMAAFAASLCCITPLIALVAGASGAASSLSWLEPFRPYLIGVAVLALGFAWVQALRTSKTTDCGADGSCTVQKESFLSTRSFLLLITVATGLIVAFPYYAKAFYPKTQIQNIISATAPKKQVRFTIVGMTCAGCEAHVDGELAKVKGVIAYQTSYTTRSSLVTYDPTLVQVTSLAEAINKTGYKAKSYDFITKFSAPVSFYEVPLVCHAAPSIGCGSKAKFILVDLEKNTDAVSEALLNRKGTLIAVRWKEAVSEQQKERIIRSVSANHGVTINERTQIKPTLVVSLSDGKEWYRTFQVDDLSREEAAIIARRTIADLKKEGLVKSSFEKQFETDIANIYTKLFLSLTSYKDLNVSAYNAVEQQIQAAGEKYVGRGKMPHRELCTTTEESCEVGSKEEKSCTTASESCCKKKE
jgi:copper chaperone CopZ